LDCFHVFCIGSKYNSLMQIQVRLWHGRKCLCRCLVVYIPLYLPIQCCKGIVIFRWN